jgi:hypothetical protein
MRRIPCIDEASNAVLVLEHPGRDIPTSTLQSTRRESTEGMKSYSLESGEAVNMISDTQFRTMAGRLLTRKTSP